MHYLNVSLEFRIYFLSQITLQTHYRLLEETSIYLFLWNDINV